MSVYAIRTDVSATDCLDVVKTTITTIALELRDGKGSASCGELSILESKGINVLDWDAGRRLVGSCRCPRHLLGGLVAAAAPDLVEEDDAVPAAAAMAIAVAVITILKIVIVRQFLKVLIYLLS